MAWLAVRVVLALGPVLLGESTLAEWGRIGIHILSTGISI